MYLLKAKCKQKTNTFSISKKKFIIWINKTKTKNIINTIKTKPIYKKSNKFIK